MSVPKRPGADPSVAWNHDLGAAQAKLAEINNVIQTRQKESARAAYLGQKLRIKAQEFAAEVLGRGIADLQGQSQTLVARILDLEAKLAGHANRAAEQAAADRDSAIAGLYRSISADAIALESEFEIAGRRLRKIGRERLALAELIGTPHAMRALGRGAFINDLHHVAWPYFCWEEGSRDPDRRYLVWQFNGAAPEARMEMRDLLRRSLDWHVRVFASQAEAEGVRVQIDPGGENWHVIEDDVTGRFHLVEELVSRAEMAAIEATAALLEPEHGAGRPGQPGKLS